MLPRHHRLTRPEDFRAVFRRDADVRTRRRAGTPLLVVHAAFPAVGAPSGRSVPTPVRPPRVGFVVSRAVGNSVVRHRVVRRLRALMAVRVPALPAGGDVVVRAQPAAAGARSTDLGRALDDALGKALGTDRTLAGAGS